MAPTNKKELVLVFYVITENTDGRHQIGSSKTFEGAKKKAEEWIGKNATWTSEKTAIGEFGDTLEITEISKRGLERMDARECGY